MKTDKAVITLNKIYDKIDRIYGKNAGELIRAGKVVNVAPTIQQNLEHKVQQSNIFLNDITVRGVRDIKGQTVGFGRPGTLRKRTSAQNSTTPAFGKRRPSNPTGLEDRGYECNNFESDPILSWDILDGWAHLPNFYAEYLSSISVARSTDILSVLWNGQFKSANTNPVAYPLLEDDQPGIFQYLIDNAPEKVLGITLNPASPGGYDIDPIHVGAGAGVNGFETLDSLVFHIKHTLIAKQFRTLLEQRVVIGDELLYRNNALLYDGSSIAGTGIDEPSERMQREAYINNQLIGSLARVRSDQFPERGLFVSPLKNIARYYQDGAMRRQIIEDHNQQGIVDYMFGRDDYVIENIDMVCAVHPDAIYLQNSVGDWKPMGSFNSSNVWVDAEPWKKVAA